MSQDRARFALCIRKGDEEDLEPRKAYPVLPAQANEAGFLRVVDESGEDYLYPADYFIVLELPQSAEQALLQAA
jgi:hypothetical protein